MNNRTLLLVGAGVFVGGVLLFNWFQLRDKLGLTVPLERIFAPGMLKSTPSA